MTGHPERHTSSFLSTFHLPACLRYSFDTTTDLEKSLALPSWERHFWSILEKSLFGTFTWGTHDTFWPVFQTSITAVKWLKSSSKNHLRPVWVTLPSHHHHHHHHQHLNISTSQQSLTSTLETYMDFSALPQNQPLMRHCAPMPQYQKHPNAQKAPNAPTLRDLGTQKSIKKRFPMMPSMMVEWCHLIPPKFTSPENGCCETWRSKTVDRALPFPSSDFSKGNRPHRALDLAPVHRGDRLTPGSTLTKKGPMVCHRYI